MLTRWIIVLAVVICLCCLGAGLGAGEIKIEEERPMKSDEPSQKKEDRLGLDQPPVQEGPPGLGEEMDRMKSRADEIISRAEKKAEAEAVFQQLALEIFLVMRPVFGPANAWLFNERQAKIDRLAQALGLGPEALSPEAEYLYEQACQDVLSLRAAIDHLGLKNRLRNADRAELMWTPAPGFAVTIWDEAATLDWVHPYAGTAAGEDEASPQRRHPTLTLFVFPPLEGRAIRPLFRREQPGELVFFSGGLIGYTLQEPQSLDVSPEGLLEKFLAEIQSRGLIFRPPADAIERLQRAGGESITSAGSRSGFIWAVSQVGPPESGWEGLEGCAVLWITESGTDQALALILLSADGPED